MSSLPVYVASLNRRQAMICLAVAAAAVSTLAVVLTPWLRLNPCYLCIVQRIMAFGLTLCFAFSSALYPRPAWRWPTLMGSVVSLAGMAASGFQSWEQWFPELVSCSGAKPNVLELMVEWLGDLWPLVFMPSGLCHNKELVVLGLSLANWSFLTFAAFFAAAIFLISAGSAASNGGHKLKARTGDYGI